MIDDNAITCHDDSLLYSGSGSSRRKVRSISDRCLKSGRRLKVAQLLQKGWLDSYRTTRKYPDDHNPHNMACLLSVNECDSSDSDLELE